MADNSFVNIGPRHTPNGHRPFLDVTDIEFQPGSSANNIGSPADVSAGVPSLFNPYAIVVFPKLGIASGNAYNVLIDGNGTSGNQFSESYLHSNPSIQTMVEDPTLALKTPYYYSDFLYCKYVGLIPNNQMITLRRYPAPTYDNLAVPGRLSSNPNSGASATSTDIKNTNVDDQKEFFPIAQAVTWFGEETGNKLSDLLSFTVSMNWKNVEAEVNVVSGNEQGSEDSPLPGVAQFLGILTGQVNTPFATANAQYDPYSQGPYNHRVYGPVNVINKTYKRDRGLDFKQTLNLNFEYSLKSIGSINPKAAMLDLMSNLLALTYNNAAFWGGANRYFPNKPTYPFLGGPEGMNAWYRGQPVTFAKAVGKQVSTGMKGFGDILSKLAEDPISTLKGLAAGAAKLGMIEMGKGRAPSIVGFKASYRRASWRMAHGSWYTFQTHCTNWKLDLHRSQVSIQ